MRLFVVLAATVVLAAGTAAFGLQEPRAGAAPCCALPKQNTRVMEQSQPAKGAPGCCSPAAKATTVSTGTPRSGEGQPPACDGNIVRAKLIVLKPTTRNEAAGVVAALRGIKGLVRLSADDESGLVSLIVTEDSPMTPERAVEYLALAGYKVVEATEEETDQAARGMQTATIDVPASVITESSTDSPRKPVHVGVLEDSIQPLVDAFNREKNRPRLVALLSPT